VAGGQDVTGRQLLLGLDTATPLTSVAVVEADLSGGLCRPLASAIHRDPRRHGEVLPTMVLGVLSEAGLAPTDLTAVAVGVGPGAYTGLRVGIATAQALALSLAVPTLGTLTVDAIAFATGLDTPFTVVTDARRREVYVSRYLDHRTRECVPAVGSPDLLVLGAGAVVATPDTPDLAAHGVDVTHVVEGPTGVAVCQAVVHRLHRGAETEPVRPLYLRRPDVTVAPAPRPVLP
jgi:tRNA threonylcarbamoyl adenosine modification protein YeaZ